MQLLIAFTLFLLCSLNTTAQHQFRDLLFQVKPITVPVYQAEKYIIQPFKIKMGFNDDSIFNKKLIQQLKRIPIKKIDLVYTSYRENNQFSQPELNKRRLDTLFAYLPDLKNKQYIQWRFYAQTAATNADSAAQLFHGFVLYPDLDSGYTTPALEWKKMQILIDSIGKLKVDCDTTCIQTRTVFKKRKVETGFYIPENEKLRRAGARSNIKTKRFNIVEYRLEIDTIRKTDTVSCKKRLLDCGIEGLVTDSTVLKVFERNQQWRHKLVVADVTGSMMPYSLQLLIWAKLRADGKEVNRFVFFNDGDNKPDRYKQPGKTGGIYGTDFKRGYKQVEETLKNAMLHGDGGDIPENNIEALIKGIAQCPDCEHIVMIADNYAPVKDLILLPMVKKPVHVILCGVVNDLVHSDYLDIARMTGGSVHTMEHDLSNLINTKEGQTFRLGKQTYKIVRGRAVAISDL